MERYQTLGKRIVASIIDSLVFTPIIVFNTVLTEIELPNSIHFVLTPVLSILGLAYNIVLHWKYGQTVGKMAAKVKVLDISETLISFRQSCLRDVVYIIYNTLTVGAVLSLLAIGYSRFSETITSIEVYLILPIFIWIFIDTLVCIKSEKNRALHDLIAGTVVVRLDVSDDSAAEPKRKQTPPSPDVYDELRVR